MSTADHRVYVISDLHLGGALPSAEHPDGRGFRICTHVRELAQFVNLVSDRASQENVRTELIINGDFTDFLAERWDGPDPWLPFAPSPHEAAERAKIMFERDRPYDALGSFLERWHSLTLILGNHDVEMSLVPVRREFERVVNAAGRSLRYVHDGEAYRVGAAIIEHGNRYDPWNVIDHDSLRRLRSMVSREEPLNHLAHPYEPPAGSYMVAGVMNMIKERFAFVDLLKPETEAVIPLILTLAPEYRSHLFRVAALMDLTRHHSVGADGIPVVDGDISAGEVSVPRSVRETLRRSLGTKGAGDFLCSIESVSPPLVTDIATDDDIAAGRVRSFWEGLKLLLISAATPLATRLPTLLAALKVFRDETGFDRRSERPPYWDAAETFFSRGFRLVVFGHTHSAKEVPAPDRDGLYVNTGTWADVIRFPYELLDLEDDRALAALRDFAGDLEHNRLASYISFEPTYARLDLKHDTIVDARLLSFPPSDDDRV